MIPKNKSHQSLIGAAAIDDDVLSTVSKNTGELLRRPSALDDGFVFVTPKNNQSKLTSADYGATASGDSFLSCDAASISTTESNLGKNKRKRVRKRKKKNAVAENADNSEMDVASISIAATVINKNPFKAKPIAANANKSNSTHVRYVQMPNHFFLPHNGFYLPHNGFYLPLSDWIILKHVAVAFISHIVIVLFFILT